MMGRGGGMRDRRRQAALFHFSEPPFWVFASIIVATGFVTVAEQRVFRQISPSGWVLAWLLVIVYALPVFLVVFTFDVFEREPLSLILGALLWGAVAATTLAAVANAGWSIALARISGPDFASRWVAAISAPWVEETLKVCGVVFLYLIARREIDDLMDGFVYGVMCGLGFAVVEDVFYFMGVFGGKPAGVLDGFFVRVLASGLYGHLLYTGLAGIGVAYFVTRRGRRSTAHRLLVAAGFMFLGVLAHFLWNSPWLDFFPRRPWNGIDRLMLPVAVAVKSVPFLFLVILMVVLTRKREARWLSVAGSIEVGGQGITSLEFESLRSPALRRRAVGDMRRRSGKRAAVLLKRLQREQINLAMLRTRAPAGDDPAAERQRDRCRSLHDALNAIPAAARASG